MTRPVNLLDVPYVQSDTEPLSLVEIDAPSLVIDLGSGDGRVLKWFKDNYPDADLIGYELDSGRASESEALVPSAQIILENMWDADVSQADVVYIYWLSNLMTGFYEVFWPQMKSGAVVISLCFEVDELEPAQRVGQFYVYKKP